MIIKPYGDTLNDGKVQISFSLPLDNSPKGIECAKEIAKKMGLINPEVVDVRDLGKGFSFYIIYGTIIHTIDTNNIKSKTINNYSYSMEEIEKLIEDKLKREVVFIGASTGTDAHTVGIDAIMNMKGFAGHYGLERYKNIRTYNLGSQIPNEAFIKKAIEVRADVLLVSQTVTQKEIHLKNLLELVELIDIEGIRDKVVLIVGGARITNELAKELGYDAGFGQNTYAEDVAAFAVKEIIRREKEIVKHKI